MRIFNILLLWSSIWEACSQYQGPIAFGVVRNISPSASYEQFLNAIGTPQFNATTNTQTGYNLMSLAGFSSSSTFTSIDSDLSPLLLWKKVYQIIMSNKANIIGADSGKIQKHIINNKFHANGSRLLMHVDLWGSPISGDNPVAANSLAQQIVTTSTTLQLDGISIYLGDYNAVKLGTASDWLQSLLRIIRDNTRNTQFMIVLIIPPQFVPLMKLFQSNAVNSLVDYFVLKYYGNYRVDYNSYSTLFQKSAQYSQTSMFQLLRRDGIYIDICRTLVAKSPDSNAYANNKQFMTQYDLNAAFSSAYDQLGWFAGYANLNYETDQNGSFANTALTNLRVQCERFRNCFC